MNKQFDTPEKDCFRIEDEPVFTEDQPCPVCGQMHQPAKLSAHGNPPLHRMKTLREIASLDRKVQ